MGGTREHGDVSVMVSARGIAPGDVTLEPLADPGNAQAGTIGDVERTAERERRDAAGELLSRAEVERLIARHDLTAHREQVLAAIRPGYWLVPGELRAPGSAACPTSRPASTGRTATTACRSRSSRRSTAPRSRRR